MSNQLQEYRLYSVSAAARIMGLGRDTLKLYMAKGKIGFIQPNIHKKIPGSEIIRFINENTKRINSSQQGATKTTPLTSGTVSQEIDNLFKKHKKENKNGKSVRS